MDSDFNKFYRNKNPADSSTKLKKARDLGVEIISHEQLKQRL